MPKMKYNNNMDTRWIGLKIGLTCIFNISRYKFVTFLLATILMICKGGQDQWQGCQKVSYDFWGVGRMQVEKDVEKENVYIGQ
jgi:hypothetical protein